MSTSENTTDPMFAATRESQGQQVDSIAPGTVPPKLDSIEPEAGGLHTVALIFQNGTPTVNKGDCRVFCALMVSRHTGKDLVLPLYYLNQMPLEKEECDCAEEHDEGCPTTGWFYDNSNFDYDNCYWPAEGEVVAWAELPKAEVVRSAFTRRASPAPVAVPAGYRLVPDAARHAQRLREVAAVLSTERIQGWANPLVTLLTDAAEAIAPQPLPENAGQWVLPTSPVPSTATQAGAVRARATRRVGARNERRGRDTENSVRQLRRGC